MHNKIGRSKILPAVSAVFIVLLIAILFVIKNNLVQSNADQKNVNQKNLYSNEHYSLILPENYTVKEEGMNTAVVFDNKKIAAVEAAEDFQYGDNIEKIVANWIGMHAGIESEEILLTEQEDEFHKVIVNVELSAAEQINGEDSNKDEVHYFYLSEDKLFIDILVYDNNQIAAVEDLIRSFSPAA